MASSGQIEDLGIRTLLKDLSQGEWVTEGLRTPQTKAKVFSLGREGIPETEKGESACRALGSKRWNRNEGEFNGLGGQYPFLSSYPRTIAVIS